MSMDVEASEPFLRRASTGKRVTWAEDEKNTKHLSLRWKVWIAIVGILWILLCTYILTVLFPGRASLTNSQIEGLKFGCNTGTKPAFRKEWRTLDIDERTNYIKAVQCLNAIPSKILDNGTLYDDFAYLHAYKVLSGETAHAMPVFLPFHRYLLHVYERTLTSECGYNGALPYWDWTLDWLNMTASPVWDPQHGFGGNPPPTGDPDEPKYYHGRCVTDGPFAGLQPLYHLTTYHPHCLSRALRVGTKSGQLFPGWGVKPHVIEDILSKDSFDGFSQALEMGPHNFIPFSIQGDFATFSSPYEPLFFLHHAQLDRLWWRWQEQNHESRVSAYGVNGTLDDPIAMHGLAEDVRIRDAMSTESSVMCYRYM